MTCCFITITGQDLYLETIKKKLSDLYKQKYSKLQCFSLTPEDAPNTEDGFLEREFEYTTGSEQKPQSCDKLFSLQDPDIKKHVLLV